MSDLLMHTMDGNALSITESISQLELSVDRSLAASSRDEVISAEARLQALLRGMHGYLNSLAPINTLPPEMLVAIFKEVLSSVSFSLPTVPDRQSSEFEFNSESESNRKPEHAVDVKPLFRLIHVCRLWRASALGNASFWAHIDVSLPNTVVRFFLRHSSEHPLTLHASSKLALVQRILEKHGAHVRTVYADSNLRRQTLGAGRTFFPPATHTIVNPPWRYAPTALLPEPEAPDDVAPWLAPFPPSPTFPQLDFAATELGVAPVAQPGPVTLTQLGAAAILPMPEPLLQPQLGTDTLQQGAAPADQPGIPPVPQLGVMPLVSSLAPSMPAAASLFVGPAPFLPHGVSASLQQGAAPIAQPEAPPLVAQPGAPPLPPWPAPLLQPGAMPFEQVFPGAAPGTPPAFTPWFRPLNNLGSNVEDTVISISLFKYFCSSAPQLECLILRDIRLRRPLSLTPLAPLAPLAPDLPLKALALVLLDAFFPTSCFSNLTHLCLSFPLLRSQESAKSLLQMLERAPNLQFLQLSNLRTNATSPEAFVHPLPHVSLGQLRLLVFSDVQLETAFYLLRYLTRPEPILLSIEGKWGNHHLVDRAPDLFRVPSIAPFNIATFMEISITEWSTLLLTGYDSHLTSSFLLKIRDFSTGQRNGWLPPLHDMMALSMITVLHICDSGGLSFPQILPFFVQLEQLSILLASGSSVDSATSTLFASLTPVTTLVCPALHSLGLQADIEHHSFPFDELEALAVGRHDRGLPIRRFVYQFHGASPPVRAMVMQAKEAVGLALIESFLSPRLAPYVDSIEYRLSSGEKVCPFVPRECWRVQAPDAERYWRMSRDRWPSYGMPWEHDETRNLDWAAARQRMLDHQSQFTANVDVGWDSD